MDNKFKDVNREAYLRALFADVGRHVGMMPERAETIMTYIINNPNYGTTERIDKHGMIIRNGRYVIAKR